MEFLAGVADSTGWRGTHFSVGMLFGDQLSGVGELGSEALLNEVIVDALHCLVVHLEKQVSKSKCHGRERYYITVDGFFAILSKGLAGSARR